MEALLNNRKHNIQLFKNKDSLILFLMSYRNLNELQNKVIFKKLIYYKIRINSRDRKNLGLIN